MRLAAFESDFWQLRDVEISHTENPDKFWIPSFNERNNLKRGDSVKLIFDIEAEEEEGTIVV